MSTWNKSRPWIVRVLVERDEGEEVGDLLRLKLLLDSFGHERQLADLYRLDIIAGDRL